MYCQNCSMKISDNSLFCTYCGYKVDFDNNNTLQEENLRQVLLSSIEALENKKIKLEKDICQLFKAKTLTLDLKDIEKKILLLKSEVESLETTKIKLEKDLEKLRESKAVLLDELDNLDTQKNLVNTATNTSEFSIEYVDSLESGFAFENYFAKLLEKLGFYNVRITDGSSDFGIDVLAYNDDILYGFQCKLYSNTVGNKSIQEAYSGKTHYNCNVAVVVTNNFFTSQAREQAKETNVLLWDRNILINKLDIASRITFTIKK